MFQQSHRIVGASVSAVLTVPPLRNVHSIRVVATIRDTSRVDANNCHTTGVAPCHHLPVGGDVMKMRIGMLTVWMFAERSNQLRQVERRPQRRPPAVPVECPHLPRWVFVLVRRSAYETR
jgi:hypothetical protein